MAMIMLVKSGEGFHPKKKNLTILFGKSFFGTFGRNCRRACLYFGEANVIMMRHGVKFIEKKAVIVNIILILLEFIAFIYDLYSFKFGLFKWYTVDSNVLQLIVSALVVIYCYHGRMIPEFVTILHFVSAVGLTVTFLIAAFVLAPEGGVDYYFFQNVAPINHLIAPILSVVSLLFLEKTERLSLRIILYPVCATLFYGIVCLMLNVLRIIDGPYFFLKVYEQTAVTIALWFFIIAVLCLVLAFIYYRIKWKNGKQGDK